MTGRTVLTGGLVADGHGGEPKPADVVIDGGRVVAVVERVDGSRGGRSRGGGRDRPATGGAGQVGPAAGGDREVLDCSGLVVAPGFVDIHTHSDLTRIACPDAPTRALQGITTEVIGNCGMSPAPLPAASAEPFASGEAGRQLAEPFASGEAGRQLAEPFASGGTDGFRGILGPIDVVSELEFGWTDCASYLDALAATPGATNLVPLVGHGSLRYAGLGLDTRPASEEERTAMAAVLDEALELGYWGLSLGMMYAPGEASDRAELDALVAVLRRHGALLTSHMRAYDGAGLVPAVREVLELAATGGVPLQISHLRSIGDDDGAAVGTAIELIEAELFASGEAARQPTNADVQADAYPYLAGHTTLLQLLPPELRGLGGAAVAEMARDEPARVAAALRSGTVADPARVVVAKTAAHADGGAVGCSLAELADGDAMPQLAGCLPASPEASGSAGCCPASPEASGSAGGDGADVAARLLARAGGNVDVIVVGSRQEDTDRVLRQPWVSVASDGMALGLDHRANLAHPRSIGTFPRAFRQLADAGVGIGEIVRKMTSQPARRVGLRDRGVLEAGAAADVVVFDPDAMRDNADYREPLRPPSGVEHVLVGGTVVVRGGAATGARPGTLLRRSG